MFDFAIIGAGINGSALAWFLTRQGYSVALFDREGIAAGGSGAAGAFISPKFSKSGPLKEISDAAFDFSLDFYERHFPEYLREAPLLHLAKHDDDAARIEAFKRDTPLHVSEPSEALRATLQSEARSAAGLYLQRSGLVDAQGVCRALCKDAHFFCEAVDSPEYREGLWQVNAHQARHIIFAIGAYTPLLKLSYLKLRGVWGHRIDITTTTQLPHHLHHYLSVAATQDGKTAIGATHNVHYHPETATEAYDLEAGRAELLEKAGHTIALENVEITADYTGLRSGSNDYLPIIGSLVDADATLQALPDLLHGAQYGREAFRYYPNCSMINGTGGYGFVLAPYLAYQLAQHLHSGMSIDSRLMSVRFFERWVKRGHSGKA